MYQKILAPLDGSKSSECSLEHVRAVATGCQVPEVVLLRVVETIRYDYQTGLIPEAVLRDAHKKAMDEANDYLTKIANKLKGEGLNVETTTAEGEPSYKILDYARNNRMDLIIISTHGRSGVSNWAFGGVTDKVIHRSTVPVLIVSPHGYRV